MLLWGFFNTVVFLLLEIPKSRKMSMFFRAVAVLRYLHMVVDRGYLKKYFWKNAGRYV